MKTCLLLLVAVVVSVSATCSTDGDCSNGCCYNNQCSAYQNLSDPCHLPNKPVAHLRYPCGCASGLTCDEIHFDPSLPAELHQAELILLGHGYGLCTDTPGALVGK